MLATKIQSDMISALKNKDQPTLNTLRYILAQIKNKEIEKKTPLTDEEVIAVLRKLTKELKESITAFEKGNRTDLVFESKNQLKIVCSYLPAEISDDNLRQEIEALVKKNQDLYQKNPKFLIGICVKELKSKADPERIISILQTLKPSPNYKK